jgi:hypothetical protein
MKQLLVLASLLCVLLTSCKEYDWFYDELSIYKTKNLHVAVRGLIYLTKDSSDKDDDRPEALITLYLDNYQTVVLSEKISLMYHLKDTRVSDGKKHHFDTGDSYWFEWSTRDAGDLFDPYSGLRVGRSSGQYHVICVKITAERSNIDHGQDLGCVYAD